MPKEGLAGMVPAEPLFSMTMTKILRPGIAQCSSLDARHGKTATLSLSYQKMDGRAWPGPPFFWNDTAFSEFESADIIDYIL